MNSDDRSRWQIYMSILAASAMAHLWQLDSVRFIVPGPTAKTIAMLACFCGMVMAMLLVVVRGGWRVYAAAALATVLFVGSTCVSIRHQKPVYTSDAVSFVHYSALLALEGHNPFQATLWPAANQRFGMPLAYFTRRTDGRPETHYSYPAGAFLLVAPFVHAGMTDLRYLLVGLLVLSAALIALGLRGDDRVAPFLLLVSYPLLSSFTVGSVIDPVWLPLAVGAWLLVERKWFAAACLLGMACSVKQQVWFLAPFLLVAICRSRDARTSLQAGVTALVCFVSVNGYYLWHDPAEWYEGLSTPFFHPLVREGIGLVRLEQGGLLGPIEQWVYLLLAASTFCGLLVAYWKWFERLAPLGPVLGLLPVYLSWRSHAASFYLLPMLLLTGLAVGRPVQPKNRPGKTAP